MGFDITDVILGGVTQVSAGVGLISEDKSRPETVSAIVTGVTGIVQAAIGLIPKGINLRTTDIKLKNYQDCKYAFHDSTSGLFGCNQQLGARFGEKSITCFLPSIGSNLPFMTVVERHDDWRSSSGDSSFPSICPDKRINFIVIGGGIMMSKNVESSYASFNQMANKIKTVLNVMAETLMPDIRSIICPNKAECNSVFSTKQTFITALDATTTNRWLKSADKNVRRLDEIKFEEKPSADSSLPPSWTCSITVQRTNYGPMINLNLEGQEEPKPDTGSCAFAGLTLTNMDDAGSLGAYGNAADGFSQVKQLVDNYIERDDVPKIILTIAGMACHELPIAGPEGLLSLLVQAQLVSTTLEAWGEPWFRVSTDPNEYCGT